MAADDAPQNAAAAVQDVAERVSLLVHEEIELAKAEVIDKLTKLLKGVAVGVAAGIFVVVGLLFVLHGFALLAWFVLPVGDTSYFWGYFFVAGVLFVLAGLAGYLAARLVKDGTPPMPEMAIEEAGKIKRTLMRFRRTKQEG